MKVRIFAVFIFIFAISCTRQNKSTTLNLQLPIASMSSGSVSAMSSGSWNVGLNPSSLAQFNCYAVFVGGPDPMLNKNSCFDSGGTVKFKFGPFMAFAPAGSQISIDVPSGPNRIITLVGLQAQNGACVPVSPNSQPAFSDLSQPFILGSVQQNLSPGTQNLTITRNFNSSDYYQHCNINNGGGSSSTVLYGTGSDGVRSIASTVPDVSTDTTILGGRTFSAAARITNIDNSTGKIITTYLPPTASQFQLGDEVMWIVMAAFDYSSAWGGSDAVCGSGSSTALPRGRYGFANVTAVTASTVEIDQPIINYPSLINNSALNYTTPPYSASTPSSFCFMQLIRVPNLDGLTIGSGASLGVTPFQMVNGFGGVIAMRVKNTLTLSGAGSTISTTGKGFQGISSYYQGTGIDGEGVGSTYSPYVNAGGSGSGSWGGGGGSNAGQGSDGMSNPGTGAAPLLLCMSSSVCSPILKGFMGGSGGGTASAGGSGGGLIYLFANQINLGANPLSIDSSGTDGTGGASGSGGGAGGSVLLYSNTISGTVSVNLIANGGNGGPATAIGGGGGGGSIFVHTCNSPSTTPTVSVNYGSGGTGATLGVNDSNFTDPFACGP